MTARPPAPDPTGPARRYPGTPRWVKVLGVISVLVALFVVLALATGLGGPHGPQRHGAGIDTTVALSVATAP